MANTRSKCFLLFFSTAIKTASRSLNVENVLFGGEIWIPSSNSSKDAQTRVRRRIIVHCCGDLSCSYSSRSGLQISKASSSIAYWDNYFSVLRDREKSEDMGDRAIATIRENGLSIACPGCAPGWQTNLKIDQEHGHIPISCPGCDVNWRSLLSPEGYAAALSGKTGTTQAPEVQTHEGEEYVPVPETESEESSTEEVTTITTTTVGPTKRKIKVTKPVKITKIEGTSTPEEESSSVTTPAPKIVQTSPSTPKPQPPSTTQAAPTLNVTQPPVTAVLTTLRTDSPVTVRPVTLAPTVAPATAKALALPDASSVLQAGQNLLGNIGITMPTALPNLGDMAGMANNLIPGAGDVMKGLTGLFG
ncbi:uncharacterized protein LOC132197916 isoform X3 [Neocloeon triangulifer]|uniref:uncharacterized protein LOC132197916 isoform X3 n=1 Tax=Neocloeon triangulifer TaxID=2078957 RepID=UPI00286F01DD|nr:uncharacterized protein LOC132197916 isoform X3 [Neocloeon triangulifer]